MTQFSIITITRNNLEGLRKTAASVQAQKCKNYEWIVIDGASGDGTQDFLKSTDATWISEPDQGIYDAMNKGIDRATGDYLIFMNAGDIFAAPDVLAKIRHIVKTSSTLPDFIYGDALEEQDSNASPALKPARTHKPARHHSKWRYGMFTHHQAMLYRCGALHESELRYDRAYPIAADYKFTIQLIGKYRNIYKIERFPICIFAQGGVSQTHVQQARKEQFRIRKKHEATPLWQNLMVYVLQATAWRFRCLCPKLYWAIKSRV